MAANMAFIHELPQWPQMTWDRESLIQDLAAVRHRQGRLLGRMEALGFDIRTEANLVALTEEVVKSSAIEGERLDTEEVRSSIARRLGLDVAGLPQPSREIDGVVEMMCDATRQCNTILTSERLWAWHAALFPTGRSGMYRIRVGCWRDAQSGPMQVVSGQLGNEKVHFQAPNAERLDGEMQRFLDWFNSQNDLDPILKAAVAHFWFVTIHPFDDGNGRIARAIADMVLARGDGIPDRFYSMSAQIERERKEYYIQLETAQRGSCDITTWITWFLACFQRAITAADATQQAVLRKARIWQIANTAQVNTRQRIVLNRMLDTEWQGHLSSGKYAKLAKCSTDTALRDIQELLARGVLLKNSTGGRNTNYRLTDPT